MCPIDPPRKRRWKAKKRLLSGWKWGVVDPVPEDQPPWIVPAAGTRGRWSIVDTAQIMAG